jgi:hypothetical protein
MAPTLPVPVACSTRLRRVVVPTCPNPHRPRIAPDAQGIRPLAKNDSTGLPGSSSRSFSGSVAGVVLVLHLTLWKVMQRIWLPVPTVAQ